MSRELVTMFFPATFGDVVKNQAPGLFYFLLPDWAAEQCPCRPSISRWNNVMYPRGVPEDEDAAEEDD